MKCNLAEVGNNETTDVTSVVDERLENAIYPAERINVDKASFAKFKHSIHVPATNKPQTVEENSLLYIILSDIENYSCSV